jgi:hypothetical protein
MSMNLPKTQRREGKKDNYKIKLKANAVHDRLHKSRVVTKQKRTEE